MRNQVIPGGRSVWMVTMKFRPVKIELKPRMKTPVTAAPRGAGGGAVGGVEGPAGVEPAGDQHDEEEHGPAPPEIEAGQVQPREGHVLGPQHQRQDEVAQGRGNAGNEEEEDHDRAVQREQLVEVSWPMMVLPAACSSSVRTSSAKTPPSRNISRIETRYITPIRL